MVPFYKFTNITRKNRVHSHTQTATVKKCILHDSPPFFFLSSERCFLHLVIESVPLNLWRDWHRPLLKCKGPDIIVRGSLISPTTSVGPSLQVTVDRQRRRRRLNEEARASTGSSVRHSRQNARVTIECATLCWKRLSDKNRKLKKNI